ncbi:MAG: efflux RND transporter permease subunit [Treponema sp.]|jgi:HAE1 family hydrophobic/amphiphilic exporter-1|nr:efflux RND transporter permease subunit [Treponema sp.]
MSVAAKIVKRPVLGIVVFALVAIVAMFFAARIPIDMLPEINPPFLVVISAYPGAGPETVENSVTRILESQLIHISGLREITSTSSENVSMIIMEFDFGADIDRKTIDARDRIDRVRNRLPDGVDSPVIWQIDVNMMPILRIAVSGDRSTNELYDIATSIVLDRLVQIDGVGNVTAVGSMERQVRVEISQNRLEAYGLTISGVAGILAAQNMELGAGFIVDGQMNYGIRTTGEFSSVQDIAETVIARRGGVDIRLLDIADVRLGYPRETSSAYINGQPGIFVEVTRQTGANSVVVADRVYSRLEEIRLLLPPDVTLEIVQDTTIQIRGLIAELMNAAVIGAALAMAVLLLFLRNIKSTVIIGISIPFSILVTLLAMYFMNITLNMLTMAGLILGIGLIVDCSIVILENIFKYRERGAKPDIAAILGSQEVMISIVSATLTTLCVFVPLILFQNQLGFIGILIQDLIITVGISLTSSLLVAIFLVPVLASTYLPLDTRKQKPLRNKVLIKLDSYIENSLISLSNAYGRLLSKAVNHKLVTTIIVVAALSGAVLALPRMQIVMMPPMNENYFTLEATFPPGTIYEDVKATMLQLQEIAMNEIIGVKSIITTINESPGGGFGSSAHGSIVVTLDPDTPGADTSEQAMNRMRARFGDFTNTELTFAQGRGFGGGADIDMVLRINDISTGMATANEIRSLIEAQVPELIEMSINMTEGLPQVEVVIDRNRAFNLGLSMNAIAMEIAAAFNGVTATVFRYEGSEYLVVLEMHEDDRRGLPDLGRIFIPSNTGALIPVSNFATLERGLGPVSIHRQNQSRVINITGTLAAGASAHEVENRIQEIMATQFILPDGISLSYAGQAGEINQTIQTFAIILMLAVLLVFGTMAGLYESFKTPFVNMFTIPLMLIGVVGIHIITAQAISMITMIGIVMLVGIVINNGIILVDYTNLLVGRGVPVKEACVEAGLARLRPVLMSALTTILGLVPLAFFPGQSAGFIQPIGLTVIGGLMSSTFITLFFIPVLYSVINGGTAESKSFKLVNVSGKLGVVGK